MTGVPFVHYVFYLSTMLITYIMLFDVSGTDGQTNNNNNNNNVVVVCALFPGSMVNLDFTYAMNTGWGAATKYLNDDREDFNGTIYSHIQEGIAAFSDEDKSAVFRGLVETYRCSMIFEMKAGLLPTSVNVLAVRYPNITFVVPSVGVGNTKPLPRDNVHAFSMCERDAWFQAGYISGSQQKEWLSSHESNPGNSTHHPCSVFLHDTTQSNVSSLMFTLGMRTALSSARVVVVDFDASTTSEGVLQVLRLVGRYHQCASYTSDSYIVPIVRSIRAYNAQLGQNLEKRAYVIGNHYDMSLIVGSTALTSVYYDWTSFFKRYFRCHYYTHQRDTDEWRSYCSLSHIQYNATIAAVPDGTLQTAVDALQAEIKANASYVVCNEDFKYYYGSGVECVTYPPDVSIVKSMNGMHVDTFSARTNSCSHLPGTFMNITIERKPHDHIDDDGDEAHVIGHECVPCPADTFELNDVCEPCPVGTRSPQGAVECSSEGSSSYLGAALGAAFGGVIFLGLAVAAAAYGIRRYLTSNAPRVNPVTVVRASICEAASLWSERPGEMSRTHKMFIRLVGELSNTNSGYLYTYDNDSIVVLFGSSFDAALFTLSLQQELMTLDYPLEILSHRATCIKMDREGRMTFRGLRVAVAMHSTNLHMEHPPYRRPVFTGHGLVTAQRLLSYSQGGQILLTRAAYDNMVEHLNDVEDNLTVKHEGTHVITDRDGPVSIYSIAPPSIVDREFHPLGNSMATTSTASAGVNSSLTQSNRSSNSSDEELGSRGAASGGGGPLSGGLSAGDETTMSAEKELLLTERARRIFPRDGIRLSDACEALAHSVCYSDKPHFRAVMQFTLHNLVDISTEGSADTRKSTKSLISSSCKSGDTDAVPVTWRHVSIILRDVPSPACKVAFLRGLHHVLESRYGSGSAMGGGVKSPSSRGGAQGSVQSVLTPPPPSAATSNNNNNNNNGSGGGHNSPRPAVAIAPFSNEFSGLGTQ
eukprot:PhM_4_TR17494/c0_g1_i1/m.44189